MTDDALHDAFVHTAYTQSPYSHCVFPSFALFICVFLLFVAIVLLLLLPSCCLTMPPVIHLVESTWSLLLSIELSSLTDCACALI
jgi:hypothetical protein